MDEIHVSKNIGNSCKNSRSADLYHNRYYSRFGGGGIAFYNERLRVLAFGGAVGYWRASYENQHVLLSDDLQTRSYLISPRIKVQLGYRYVYAVGEAQFYWNPFRPKDFACAMGVGVLFCLHKR